MLDSPDLVKLFAALSMGYSSYEELENIKNNGTVEEKKILYLRTKLAATNGRMEVVLFNLGFGPALALEVRHKIEGAFNDPDEKSKLVQVEDTIAILIENLVELKPNAEWQVLAFCDNTINCVKNIEIDIAMIDAERAVLH